MSLGITISSGKTGQGGTNAGWRKILPLYEWDCPVCDRHNAKHWNRCPNCATEKPSLRKKPRE